MVIVSHDREFLDNLCTKIVETERGVATTYKVGGVPCVCVCAGGVYGCCTAQHSTTQHREATSEPGTGGSAAAVLQTPHIQPYPDMTFPPSCMQERLPLYC